MTQHKTAMVPKARVPNAEAWGAVTIWEPEHGHAQDFIASLQPGDLVGVWACEDLAPEPGKRDGQTRRQRFRRAAEDLIAANVAICELKTGRTSDNPADLVAMMLDALDRISGVSGSKKRGRPPKVPFSDDEKEQIALAWFNGLLSNNDERVAAAQKLVPRFMKHDFYTMQGELEAIARGETET